MLPYLLLTGLKLGLVINFGERMLKAGIHRVVNGLPSRIDCNAKTQRRNSGAGGGQPVEHQNGPRFRLAVESGCFLGG